MSYNILPETKLPLEIHNFYMRRRQALLIELGAIEDYLGIERSITPKHRREEEEEEAENNN